jgi:aspartyl-tRNA(Asn)/glutamyl-tRNA(Gln) amidotransferase subunit B
MGDFFAALNRTGSTSRIAGQRRGAGRLIDLIADGTINGRIAKDVFEEMVDTGNDPGAIVEEKGLRQVTDTGAIEAAVDACWPPTRTRSRNTSGKDKLFGFFVGQVMKAMAGKGNPALVNEKLREANGNCTMSSVRPNCSTCSRTRTRSSNLQSCGLPGGSTQTCVTPSCAHMR